MSDDMKTKRLESGEIIPAGYFGNLWDDIRSKTLRGDGRTCRVNRTPEGTTISIIRQPQNGGGGAEPHAVPCKVTGGTSATGYTVNIYGNGVDSDPTGAGILHLVEVAYGSNLPVGAWCLGHPHETALTGGN